MPQARKDELVLHLKAIEEIIPDLDGAERFELSHELGQLRLRTECGVSRPYPLWRAYQIRRYEHYNLKTMRESSAI